MKFNKKSKVLAGALGFSILTAGFIGTSANASTEKVSAGYNVEQIKEQDQNAGVEPRKFVKAAKKVGDEVKSWALWDALLGDNEVKPDSKLHNEDVNVIFDK